METPLLLFSLQYRKFRVVDESEKSDVLIRWRLMARKKKNYNYKQEELGYINI